MRDDLVTREPERGEAGHAHDAEEREIVNINEIAERADEHGRLKNFAKLGTHGRREKHAGPSMTIPPRLPRPFSRLRAALQSPRGSRILRHSAHR
jgi:hypothetical protein